MKQSKQKAKTARPASNLGPLSADSGQILGDNIKTNNIQKQLQKLMPKTHDVYHAREPQYAKSAVIAWWLQSTSAQNSVPCCY